MTLPLVFERNEGQFPAEVGFLGRTPEYSVVVGQKDLRFTLPGKQKTTSIVLTLEGSQAALPVGLTKAPFRTNYYLGSDPAKYRTGISNYSRIGLSHVYPGVDAEFYASGENIEHDFLLAPGADASAISMRLSGTGTMKLNAQGEVFIPAEMGELRLKKPVAYQIGADGKHVDVAAAFILSDAEGEAGLRFRLGAYDHSRALVIDPVIAYATYLGGTPGGSTASAVAATSGGDAFLTGYTAAPAAGFGVTSTMDDSGDPSSLVAYFVARFNNSDNGSKAAWLTYVGAADVASQSTSIALQQAGTGLVFVGGTTAPLATPNATMGFLTTFASADGTLKNTLVIDSGAGSTTGTAAVTAVTAVAGDSLGNVIAVGNASGTTLPVTSDAFPVAASLSGTGATLGFIYKIDPLLATPVFISYLAGDVASSYTSFSGVVSDPNAKTIYVGGYTTGDFPEAGVYNSSATPPAPAMNAHNTGDAAGAYDSFVAQVVPTGTTSTASLGYTAWLSGTGNDQVNAITLDSAGNLFAFGQTTSPDLPGNNTTYTSAPGTGTAITTPTPGQTGSPATATLPAQGPATMSGFATKLDPTGQPLVLTYLGGTGNDEVTAGGVDASGLIYAAGVSNSNLNAAYPNATVLAPGQDSSSSSVQHGFLLQLPSGLSAVNYVANLGGAVPSAAGVPNPVGVALDGAANAYVSATFSPAPLAYTSYTAFQPLPPAAAASAYLAEVANATASAQLTLTDATFPSPIVFAQGQANALSYKWTLTSGLATPPADVLVQIPAQQFLTFNSLSITDQTTGQSVGTCAVKISGASCFIALFPAQAVAGTNDPLTVALSATLNADPQASGVSSLSVTASAYGPGPLPAAGSDFTSATETSPVQTAPTFTVAGALVSPANNTVFTTATGAPSPNTLASYSFTLSNTGATASDASTSFSLTATGTFVVSAVSAPGASCTLTGCTNVLIPASGSVVVTVSGTYQDTALPAGGASVTSSNVLQTSVTDATYGSSTNYSYTPGTLLERGVHLVVSSSLSAAPAGQTAFNLGNSIVNTITVTNRGPSASSGADTLAVTLPAGFVVDPTRTSASGLTCTSTTSCVLSSTASGSSATYTITGSFPDTLTSVLGSPVAETFSASATLMNAFESGSMPGDYTSTPPAINVQRTATITVANTSTALGTVCAGGGTACVYMANASATGQFSYSFAVTNSGPNTSVGTQITITLPSAPATATGAHPLLATTLKASPPAPAFGAALSCSFGATTNQIVCSGGNLPAGTSAFTISGLASPNATTVPTTVAFVTTTALPGSVAVSESALGAPPNASLPALEIDRASHLVTLKSVAPSGSKPGSPINLDENNPALTPGVNDTLTVTLSVGNTPLNDAPGVVLTDTIPAYFRVTVAPPSAQNCTVLVNGVAQPLQANFSSPSGGALMTCSLGTVLAGTGTSSASGSAGVTNPAQTFTYSGKFLDNGINPDVTGALTTKVKQLTVSLAGAVSKTSLAVDPTSPSDATSASASIGVIRSAHLILRKLRNVSVATAPAAFTNTAPNLDEKTTLTTFGVNDEIEYDITVANAGVNQALGVQFSDVLPPYFTLAKTYLAAGASALPDSGANAAPATQLPAGSLVCFAGSSASGTPLTYPFLTGATTQQITCSYGSSTAPLALPAGSSRSGAFDNATSIEFIYQGKFQDNAPGIDNIPAGVSTYSVASNAGDAMGVITLAVDPGPASDSVSSAVPAYLIQRAAHLTLLGSPQQILTNEAALVAGGPGLPPIIAEAEPSATGGTPVYNCLRYKVYIENTGPNIARQPKLVLTTPAGLNLTSSETAMTTTPGSDSPLPSSCAYGVTVPGTITAGPAVPLTESANAALVVDVDGYFGLNTLTSGNALTLASTVAYTSLSDAGIVDSGAKNTPFTTVTGPALTVVNTPFGSNFVVSPFSGSSTRPATLVFGTVNVPGITSESISPTGPALPSGVSPDPRGSSSPIALYRTGSGTVNFYTLGTTALLAAGTNPTHVCLANAVSGSALSDSFAKPERVLLWALTNLPTGTTLNTVPRITSPYTGDITTSVTPLSASSYVEAGGPALPYTTFAAFPAPQSQPAQICGQLNGFAAASAPVTLAALEPVNFSPLITTNTATLAPTPGKGVSEVSFLFPTSHDYNDNDPCYIASSTSGTGTRQSCDDNLVLTTWIFGGEDLIPSLSHVVGPLVPAASIPFVTNPIPYEVQGGATLFDLVADQLGVLAYKAANFCDPGIPSTSYTPINPCSPALAASAGQLSGTPPQETIFGSADIAQLTPSLSGGSGALTILPPATNAGSSSTTVLSGYLAASATVTAGQTVGFQWKLGDVVPSATGGTYTLSCYMVDAATLSIAMPFPAGLSCQIPSTISFPAGFTTSTAPSNPAIYVVTSGTLNARNQSPAGPRAWRSGAGIVVAALLLPLALVRRRYPRQLGFFLWALLFAGAAVLSGCGSGGATSSSVVTPAGTYYFRANAVPTAGTGTLTSTAFSVKVVPGD